MRELSRKEIIIKMTTQPQKQPIKQITKASDLEGIKPLESVRVNYQLFIYPP